MRLLSLIGAIGFAFVNCVYQKSWLYIAAAVCGFIWFMHYVGDSEPKPGERFITLAGAGLTIGAVWYMFERHVSIAGELAFLIVIVLITFFAARERKK